MFVELITMINTETLNLVFKLFPTPAQEMPVQRQVRAPRPQQMTLSHAAAQGMGFQGNREPVSGEEERDQRPGNVSHPAAPKPQPVHVGEKVGRNDPCPCGSGKKYKQCHGK